MIDSHCHLFYEGIFEDLNNKLEYAKSMGIEYFLTVGVNSKKMYKNIEIAEKYSNIVCSIGIHPLEYYGGYNLSEMKKLATNNNKIVAIGEVGLEYHYLDVPKTNQIKLFEEMLQLARDTNLPVILHCRECFDDNLFSILNNFKLPAVFHCFSDSLENAKRVINEGYYLSLSGIVTFKKSNELREVAKYVPEDKLLIETDSPYLAPVPHRGKTNEPGFVRYVAECVAEARGCQIDYLSSITDANFFRLFPRAKVMLEKLTRI